MPGFVPSSGTISFENNIEDVFEDQSPPTMSLSEYYRNGTNIQTAVTASNVDQSTVVTSGIPTSGTISFSDFRSQGYDLIQITSTYIFDIFSYTANTYAEFGSSSTGFDTQFSIDIDPSFSYASAVAVGGGGGGGASEYNPSVAGVSGCGGGGGGLTWGAINTSSIKLIGGKRTLYITVGGRGGAGTYNGGGQFMTDGQDGGDSIIKFYDANNSLLIDWVKGHGGKGGASNTITAGGAGGTGSSGYATYLGLGGGDGGDGGASVSSGFAGSGGGGAGGYTGRGGHGQASSAASSGTEAGDNAAFGSGGGGGGRAHNPNTFTPEPDYYYQRMSGGAVGLYGKGDDGKKFGDQSAGTQPGTNGSKHGSIYYSAVGNLRGLPRVMVPGSSTSNSGASPGSIRLPLSNGASIQNSVVSVAEAASPGAGGAGADNNRSIDGMHGGYGGIRLIFGTYVYSGSTYIREYPLYRDAGQS